MIDASELNALCATIGWKGPALAEKLGINPAAAYAMKAGTKECPPADLDWLRRLAAAHEATPRVPPEPDYRHVTLGPPTMEPQFQQDDPQTAERLAAAIAYRSEVTPSPETDMDPNLVLTTLLDVYGETGEDGAAAISEALNRLGLLGQARAIMRQRAAVKMGLPEVAPARERFES